MNLDDLLNKDKPTSNGALSVTGVNSETGVEHFAPVRIPRPRNAWIIFRQTQSANIRKNNPSLTAADVCES